MVDHVRVHSMKMANVVNVKGLDGGHCQSDSVRGMMMTDVSRTGGTKDEDDRRQSDRWYKV